MSVYWIHAGTAERVRNECHKIAKQVGISGWNDLNLDVLELFKDWCESEDSGKWLIVYDNADDVDLFYSEQGNRFAKYFPRSDHGSILMTTRNRQVGFKFASAKNIIALEPLSESESCALITAKLGEDDSEHTDRLELATALGGIPLALVQATAFIQENECTTITRYLEIYNSSDMDKTQLLSQDFEDDIRDPESKNPIAQTWAVTFEHLRLHEPSAAATLCLMSMFSSQAIPESLIVSAAHNRDCTLADVERTLGILQNHSLITLRCTSTESRGCAWDLHRLIQLVTRNWLSMSATDWTYEYFLAQGVKVMSYEYKSLFKDSQWVIMRMKPIYMPHALELISSPMLLLQGDDVFVPEIFQDQRLQDEEHAESGSICSYCTATILWEMYGQQYGREEDRSRMFEKAVAILTHTRGPEHLETLCVRHLQADWLSCMGKHADAELIERDVQTKFCLIFGATSIPALDHLEDLAKYLKRQGNDTEAERLLQQVVLSSKEQHKECPEGSPGIFAMIGLSDLYIRQGRVEEAYQYNSILPSLVRNARELFRLAKSMFSQHEYVKAEGYAYAFWKTRRYLAARES